VHRLPSLTAAVSVAVAITLAATPAAATPAAATPAPAAPVVRTVAVVAPDFARDISFPQCNGPLPAETSADLGVLGTNNGIAFTRNPCLVHQLAWAKRLPQPPAFYANTGNPGPGRSRHWPIGQTSPKVCSAADPSSLGCSYDYGWNAGWHSYSVAVDAAQELHRVSRWNARARAANVDWWLDVGTMNSWQSREGATSRAGQDRDIAALQGELDALRMAGVDRVGIYSTPYQWTVITGAGSAARAHFGGLPQWLAGYGSRAAAIAGCADPGFTGGPVAMTQYLGRDGFDADAVCRGGAGT
jgi:hypothetical protein